MEYSVEYTDEFAEWWDTLSEDEQVSVDVYVRLLEERGIALSYPYSSDVKGSRRGQMRESRIQHKGNPYRVLYAFDPRRTAILLIGGSKVGNDQFYAQYVPLADKIYDDHLSSLEREPGG